MKIVKNDHNGKLVWEYPGKCIQKTPIALLFEARFNRHDLEFQEVLLKEGDLFLELYPFGKWFNIFEIHDKDSGNTKAWYCNVTRPIRVDGDILSYDDLALDLFAYPDGSYRILDQDEFSQLNIPNQERKKALNGLTQLEAIFSNQKRFMIENYLDFI